MLQNKKSTFITGGLIGAAVLLFGLSSNEQIISNYGANRTLGWWRHAGDILPFTAYSFIFIGFILVYLALYKVGARLNKTLAVLHAVSFLTMLPFYMMTRVNGEALVYFVYACLLLSVVFFTVNIILSIIKYRRQKEI